MLKKQYGGVYHEESIIRHDGSRHAAVDGPHVPALAPVLAPAPAVQLVLLQQVLLQTAPLPAVKQLTPLQWEM